MAKHEKTSSRAASSAAKVLKSKTTSNVEKRVAASALTQMGTGAKTSSKIASAAAKILKDPKASRAEKTVAASVLTQFPAKEPSNAAKIRKAIEKYYKRG